MMLRVNGTCGEYTASMTLAELLEILQLKPAGLVVELNGQVVARSDYPARVLNEQDRLEILQLVGGG